MTEQIKEYWSQFYAGQHTLSPTPFARSLAGELTESVQVLDIGCGNGRDSIFFAGLGHRVLGLDVAAPVIATNREVARQRQVSGVAFEELDLGARGGLDSVLKRLLGCHGDLARPLAVYGRFFLHAITEEEETVVLAALAGNARSGDRCFFEFRTDKDRPLLKRFGTHYRRFINLDDFLAKAREIGRLKCLYRTEGRGMASYRDEDPIVARVYLGRS